MPHELSEEELQRLAEYFSKRGTRSYTTACYQMNDYLVFGPETRGLPKQWLTAHSERALRIPIRAEARSLNLANAVAIAGSPKKHDPHWSALSRCR